MTNVLVLIGASHAHRPDVVLPLRSLLAGYRSASILIPKGSRFSSYFHFFVSHNPRFTAEPIMGEGLEAIESADKVIVFADATGYGRSLEARVRSVPGSSAKTSFVRINEDKPRRFRGTSRDMNDIALGRLHKFR